MNSPTPRPSTELRRASAFAPSNIALTKYWGKRDSTLNLPLASSISVALADLGSYTVVQPAADLDSDVMLVDDQDLDPAGMVKVRRVLDEIRKLSNSQVFSGLRSVNTVPAARGLASSASAFAALAVAAAHAYGLELDGPALSRLARTGSGSASRSVPGGIAIWHAGQQPDGADSYAEQLYPADYWPLRVLVARIGGRKKISSTEGMRLQGGGGSPYQHAWIEQCHRDVALCQEALALRSMRRLAEVVEGNALAMHASMLANRPPIIYWQPATLAVIDAVRQLRAEGCDCCFTIDAGASVVVLCEAQDARVVAQSLAEIEGVEEVLQTRVGPGARLVDSRGE